MKKLAIIIALLVAFIIPTTANAAQKIFRPVSASPNSSGEARMTNTGAI